MPVRAPAQKPKSRRRFVSESDRSDFASASELLEQEERLEPSASGKAAAATLE